MSDTFMPNKASELSGFGHVTEATVLLEALTNVRDAVHEAYIPCTCRDCDADGCDGCVSCCRHERPLHEIVRAALSAAERRGAEREREVELETSSAALSALKEWREVTRVLDGKDIYLSANTPDEAVSAIARAIANLNAAADALLQKGST